MLFRSRFDRDAYFEAAPKALILTAITEGVGLPHAEKLANAKKPELAAFAQHNVKPEWLPPELRSEGYAGPGAKEAVAAKPAKKPAVKKATKKRGKK